MCIRDSGWCAFKNLGAAQAGSVNIYLVHTATLNNGYCTLASSYNSYGLWQLYDSSSRSIYLIRPKVNTNYRILSASPLQETISTSADGAKYWQFIKIAP